jgi:hypothetical protein
LQNTLEKTLLTLTEGGMLIYWVFATLVAFKWFNIPPEHMYSDYENSTIVSWNWSFFPLDVLFAVIGLIGRFSTLETKTKEILSIVSLSLMFCAGLMAVSFWSIEGFFDPFWWGINLWLVLLSVKVLACRISKTDI